MDRQNNVDVVMPCYIMNEQHLELTKRAVASLGEVNLIIVDDCSPQGGGYLRSVANEYIRNSTNLGYGKSVNKGLKLAQSTSICISNNDIRISPNWQEVVGEVFEKNEDVYSCHFRMTNYDVPFAYGNTIATSGRERWCHASFFVINTNKVKFFYDENFVNTYDDYDYFQTVRVAGFKQAYTDKACFQHQHSSTIPMIKGQEEKTKNNYEYYKEKWGEYPDVLFAKDFPLQMGMDYWRGFDI